MNQTLYTSASDRRPTPRHPPLSQPIALLALLLCAASPVASEQPEAVPLLATYSIATNTATQSDSLVIGHGQLNMLEDNQLEKIRGRNTTHSLAAPSNSEIGVILWDELKSGNKNKNSAYQTTSPASNNNQQSNSLSMTRAE